MPDSSFSSEREFILPRNIKFDLELDRTRQRIVATAVGIEENVPEITSGIEIGSKWMESVNEDSDIITKLKDNLYQLEYTTDNEQKKETLDKAQKIISEYDFTGGEQFKEINNTFEYYDSGLKNILVQPSSMALHKDFIRGAKDYYDYLFDSIYNNPEHNLYEHKKIADIMETIDNELANIQMKGVKVFDSEVSKLEEFYKTTWQEELKHPNYDELSELKYLYRSFFTGGMEKGWL